jgi:ribosomal protein L13
MGDIIGLGGWTGRSDAKNYRHKKFDRTKKVVTGQSQNAKKRRFKSILAMAILDMMRKTLRTTQHYATFYAYNERRSLVL